MARTQLGRWRASLVRVSFGHSHNHGETVVQRTTNFSLGASLASGSWWLLHQSPGARVIERHVVPPSLSFSWRSGRGPVGGRDNLQCDGPAWHARRQVPERSSLVSLAVGPLNRRNQSPDTTAQPWSQPTTNFVPGGGAPGGVIGFQKRRGAETRTDSRGAVSRRSCCGNSGFVAGTGTPGIIDEYYNTLA